MTEQTTAKRQRRMAREPQDELGERKAASAHTTSRTPSKLDQLETLLTRETGASIAEMMETTGWQQHSVRGAMAGALKKRGLTITSEKVDGLRRYRAEQTK